MIIKDISMKDMQISLIFLNDDIGFISFILKTSNIKQILTVIIFIFPSFIVGGRLYIIIWIYIDSKQYIIEKQFTLLFLHGLVAAL